jgi:hypothetical protein
MKQKAKVLASHGSALSLPVFFILGPWKLASSMVGSFYDIAL